MAAQDRSPGPIVELDQATFEALIGSPGIVLVDCWAAWCRACEAFQPVFEDAARRHPTCTFAKVNTQQEKALTAALGIEHIPSLVLYRDGLLLFNQPGYFDAAGLDEIISQAESLDIERVRAAIEADAIETDRACPEA
jgi:thioredoxin 1